MSQSYGRWIPVGWTLWYFSCVNFWCQVMNFLSVCDVTRVLWPIGCCFRWALPESKESGIVSFIFFRQSWGDLPSPRFCSNDWQITHITSSAHSIKWLSSRPHHHSNQDTLFANTWRNSWACPWRCWEASCFDPPHRGKCTVLEWEIT